MRPSMKKEDAKGGYAPWLAEESAGSKGLKHERDDTNPLLRGTDSPFVYGSIYGFPRFDRPSAAGL
jgi:hypothetical protein